MMKLRRYGAALAVGVLLLAAAWWGVASVPSAAPIIRAPVAVARAAARLEEAIGVPVRIVAVDRLGRYTVLFFRFEKQGQCAAGTIEMAGLTRRPGGHSATAVSCVDLARGVTQVSSTSVGDAGWAHVGLTGRQGVAAVRVSIADGRTVTVPVREGLWYVLHPGVERAPAITGKVYLDAGGNPVGP